MYNANRRGLGEVTPPAPIPSFIPLPTPGRAAASHATKTPSHSLLLLLLLLVRHLPVSHGIRRSHLDALERQRLSKR